MDQKLIDAAREYADNNEQLYGSGYENVVEAFKAGAECLKKIQAENRAKVFTDFNLDSHESPSFIPFPKYQLKELQEYEWQKYRMEVAKDVLVSLTPELGKSYSYQNVNDVASTAVSLADALIAELKKSEK